MSQFNFPRNWNDINVYQYQEIRLAKNKYSSGDLTSSELVLEVLSILEDTTPDDEKYYALDYDDFEEIKKHLGWVFNEPVAKVPSIHGFTSKDMNKLTVGEFIDVEHFVEQGLDENLHIIGAILFKKTKIDEWDNLIEEPYIYDIYVRGEQVLDWTITDTLYVIDQYLTFKKSFMESYGNLFNEDLNESEDTQDTSELTGRDKILAKKEELEEKAKSKWSWENLLWNLCGEDITKMEAVFQTSLILTFNIMSMKHVTKS